MVAISATSWKDSTAGAQSIVTVLAVVIGGLWAYRRFVIERDHSERLMLDVAATVVAVGSRRGRRTRYHRSRP